jgi:hypothetical protein
MRIDGNGRIVEARKASAAPGPSGAAAKFQLALEQGAGEAAAIRATSTLASVDAMLVLQSVEDSMTRRRRAVRRGRSLLDVLDGIKIGLLDGAVSPSDISRLAMLVRDAREGIDDPALESVLAEIELRAAVELAKLERRNS